MQVARQLIQPQSPKLIQFCKKAFTQHPRYKSWFFFADARVKLVLDDFGDSPQYPLGEVQLVTFEVHPKARGQGLGGLALKTLTEGADIYSVHLSLLPAAFCDKNDALTQRQLESFYRRYGFRAERGHAKHEPGQGRQITSMIRKPEGLKR